MLAGGCFGVRNGAKQCENVLDFEEVDGQLKQMMQSIYRQCTETAEEYGYAGNLMVGANIAGFRKVADAMIAQGVI